MADGKPGRRPDSPELKAAKKKLKDATTDDAKAQAKAEIDRIKEREKAAKQGGGATASKTTEASVWRPEDLDDEQLRVVFLQNVSAVTRADAMLERAKEDRKSAIATAQAQYGQSFLEHMKLDERLQRDDGKRLFCETMEGAARIARWNNVPIQTDLFSEDRMPIEDRTFDDGKRVGMAGGDPQPPSHLGGPLMSKWTEGYHAGQDAARNKLLTMREPPPARDLDEGTEVFDYFAAGEEAFRRGDDRDAPVDYSAVQVREWMRGWNHANETTPDESDSDEAAAAA